MSAPILNSRVQGSGEPVVLIHGLFGSLENLGILARNLAEDFRVYSLDLPNHGRSPHFGCTDLSDLSAAIAHWMDQQGLSQAAFVGHSLGGKVAMELALSDAKRVTRLAVLDIAPVQYTARHNDVFAGLEAINLSAVSSRKEAEQAMAEHVQEPAVRSFLLKNLVREQQGFVWRMNLSGIKASYSSLIGANREGQYDGATLFLKGGNSDYLREEYRPQIAARFPQASARIVNDTGHWLHAEKPDMVSAIVRRFIQAK